MDKTLSPREIDVLIPKMDSLLQHMDVCQKRVQELNAERPALSAKPSAADVAESARIRSQIEFLLLAVQDDIAHIAQMGGVVKDIEAGLVDFLGRVEGEEVWLCWKRGENKIHFWHPLSAGFSQRRELERNEERTSTTH